MKIEWKDGCLKDLEKLEIIIARRIIQKVNEIIEKYDTLDIKRLKGCDYFRLRVGDYRVIFSIDNEVVTIIKAGHRKNIYV